MIRPKTDTLDIVYNLNHTEEWEKYVVMLNKFLDGKWRAGVILDSRLWKSCLKQSPQLVVETMERWVSGALCIFLAHPEHFSMSGYGLTWGLNVVTTTKRCQISRGKYCMCHNALCKRTLPTCRSPLGQPFEQHIVVAAPALGRATYAALWGTCSTYRTTSLWLCYWSAAFRWWWWWYSANQYRTMPFQVLSPLGFYPNGVKLEKKLKGCTVFICSPEGWFRVQC